MKKYSHLLKKKQTLEKKIEILCNKFTQSTGLIVKNAEMNLDIQLKQKSDLTEKILPNYQVQINCEI
jgi:hypothetical protein